MTKSYLFYDIETTGLNPSFDQILQFAAIRTDLQLNELDRCNRQIRLRPDVIPSPRALLTHRMQIDKMTAGTREYEAIIEIHGLLNHPGTVSIGYNSLNFDDDFLRFSFHRNLLPPYTHQFHNGCNRMDLYPMAIMYWLYRREVLAWPEISGRPSLRLEDLNAANQWVPGPSHDALSDVEATLALAQKLFLETDMWEYLAGFFNKAGDGHRIVKLPAALESTEGKHQMALMVSGEFGLSALCQAPVLFLGHSIPYGNQTLWLRLDLPELRQTTLDNIDETTWVARKKMGEPGFVLPPLDRFWQRLEDQRRQVSDENMAWLRDNPAILSEIIRYHVEFRYPEVPEVDADSALYQMGFLSKKAQQYCRAFHESAPENRAGRINALPNPTLQELARRILLRNELIEPDAALAGAGQRYWDKVNPGDRNEAMVDYKGHPRRTPRSALVEIKTIKAESGLSTQDLDMLGDLESYIVGAFLSIK